MNRGGWGWGGTGKKADPKPKLSVLGMAVMMWVSEGEASVTGWGDWRPSRRKKE